MQQQIYTSLPIQPQTPPEQSNSNPSDSQSSQITQSSSPRNSNETQPAESQYLLSKKKRPTSNYFRRGQASDNQQIRKNQVQLKLIEEVNNQITIKQKSQIFDQSKIDQSDKVPYEGNIGLQSSLNDYNNNTQEGLNTINSIQMQQQSKNSQKTRAQLVPKSETLAPVFQKPKRFSHGKNELNLESCKSLNSMRQQNYYSTPKIFQRNLHEQIEIENQNALTSRKSQVVLNSSNSQFNHQQLKNSQQTTQYIPKSPQVQSTNIKFDLEPQANQKQQPKIQNLMGSNIEGTVQAVMGQPRPPACQTQERQIKYLGLVIEKDEEYIIMEDDLKMMYRSLQEGTITRFSANELERYHNPTVDITKRQYYPIRDKYIKIVKNSRKLSIESFEKRGRKDLKLTSRSLGKVAKVQRRLKYEEQLSNQIGGIRINN